MGEKSVSIGKYLDQENVGLTDEQLENELKFPTFQPNVFYKFRVIAPAPEAELNLDNGNQRFFMVNAPVDENGVVYKPKIRWYVNAPYETSETLLAEYGLPANYQTKVPSPIWQRILARALEGEDVFPRSPHKNPDTEEIEFAGDTLTDWDEATAIKKELNRKIDDWFAARFGSKEKGELLVGAEFYAQVEYNDDGFANIVIDFDNWDRMPRHDLPEGAEVGSLPLTKS